MLSKITAAVLFASSLAAPTPLVKHETLNVLSKVDLSNETLNVLSEGVLDDCLTGMKWRSEKELSSMSDEDKRNTVISELNSIPGLPSLSLLQGKDNGQLSEICKELAPVTISGLSDEYDGTYYVKEVSNKLIHIEPDPVYPVYSTYVYEDGPKFEKEDGRCLSAVKYKGAMSMMQFLYYWELRSTCDGYQLTEAMPKASRGSSGQAISYTRPCDSSLVWMLNSRETGHVVFEGVSTDCAFN